MEIDHNLSLEDGELKIHSENPLLAKVDFWLDTPKGQYWGRARWGHRYNQFRHEPLSVSTEVAMENMTIADLEVDIPQIVVTGISIQILGKDQFQITINTNAGVIADKPIFI